MILVTTAGKVGNQTAHLLAARGEAVRVLVRRPDAHAALIQAGAELVQGDLSDHACIDPALRGVSTVVLVSAGVPGEELAVIAGAVTAGVEHVMKITSDASADSPVQRRRDHHRIEAGLAESGLSYTLLRCNAYMQNLLVLAPAIASTGAFGSVAGDGRIGMVDCRDVAAAAAQIAASPAEHAGKTYWISGPETLSYAQAAEQLSAALGRPIRYRTISAEEQQAAMIAAGMPATLAHANTEALELFAHGDSDWCTDDITHLLGRPARTFHEFVADHKSAFTEPTTRT